MDVEMGDGDFHLATCSATPKRSLFGRASAIVPGFVYGLRVRDSGDDGAAGNAGNAAAPRESLVVFMPRGALIAGSADPSMPLDSFNTGSFTRLTFPLRSGEAGAASVRISPASLSLWSYLRRSRAMVKAFEDPSAPHTDLLVGIDVVSQGAAAMGILSLSLPSSGDPRPFAKFVAAAASAAVMVD
jgi:hypothetical protein